MAAPDDPHKARVLVVDDLPDIRVLLRTILRFEAPWIEVVEAADGAEALLMADLCQPDVILLDLSMPRLDGLAAIPEITARAPGARIVVFSAFAAAAMKERTRVAGAAAYHERTDPIAAVATTITTLAAV